ncbi:MAG: dihydrolipoyllysine-residue succinyltransferase component of 2-oxoglutarate dehydrogenase complex [Cyclobacteriaceae bacterium]|nr:MAG: dihydrolipoyllysine-residue succinyltransferase component of 2-oxoglutarate dehydrogenase complex [Cyclobacteriaceae bacterium]
MSVEIKVPQVGESITEVTISEWFKKDGDYVELDEIICELESDKASFELNAEAAGVLKIKAQEGETVEIGAVICEIDTAEGVDSKSEEHTETSKSSEEQQEKEKAVPGADVAAAPSVAEAGGVIEMRVPEVGESITEVTLASWIKQDGDYVELDENIADIDSDKASFELPAEANGILRPVAQEGDVLEIGALICKIEVTDKAVEAPKDKPAPETTAKQSSTDENYAKGHPSPAAAKILSEKGILPDSVAGSGVGGRITKQDAAAAKAPEADEMPQVASTPAGSRQQRREKMSSLRKTIARRLVAAKNETAMLTTFNEVDMKPIMDIRSKYKEKFKDKKEVGLGFMSFFTKAVCMALQEWPAVNATLDEQEIVYNDFCDISIAVSSPRGLVVPVIRNAESLSFEGIEKEVVRLATKARDGKLTIEEMTGGTFTITNGGIFGSMLSTPIINQPQSAILGMHNIVERPVAVNGEIVIRPIMYVAVSYDHRIIDGRESVSFLYRVKEFLEDPTRMLVGI